MTTAEIWDDSFTPTTQAERDAQLSRGFVGVSSDRAINLGSAARLSVVHNEAIPTDEHLERFTKQCREMFAQAKQDDRDAQFVLRLVTDQGFRARKIAELRTRRLISPAKASELLAADNEGKAP